MLEPFCFMLIYAFIFGYMLGHKELYYNVYIFVGLAIWDFFNRCIKSSVRMVKRNKSIVSKVYLPKHTLIMSDMMVNAFKMLICFGLSAGMIIYYRVPGWLAGTLCDSRIDHDDHIYVRMLLYIASSGSFY